MDLDDAPLAAYLVTLTLTAASGPTAAHRIRTTGRNEDHIRANFTEAALRRNRAFYDLDDAPDDDGTLKQLTVEWGNVTSWELGGFRRGRTWRTAKRPPPE